MGGRLTLLLLALGLFSASAEIPPEQHNPLEYFQNSVRRTNVQVNPHNISFTVNQTQLPAEGGWVEVTWSNVPYPGSDDLIALYVPADANPRETSFAKYQWAIASQDHLAHGTGSLRCIIMANHRVICSVTSHAWSCHSSTGCLHNLPYLSNCLEKHCHSLTKQTNVTPFEGVHETPDNIGFQGP